MYHFTPIAALAGGLLIGLSAALLWWLNGRIAGITGILANAFQAASTASLWRWLFLLGLVLGAGTFVAVTDAAAQQLRQGFPVPLLIVSGLLTGFGTALANGCTSGHGVCGLGRLSVRSVVATLTFLTLGIVTTYLACHVLGVFQ
jgi:uncharacterized membrane protein YedE/YeeE